MKIIGVSAATVKYPFNIIVHIKNVVYLDAKNMLTVAWTAGLSMTP